MATMLGTTTFDAQMSDYPAQGDLDVLMQAHSTDPWIPQEDGIMEEDTSFSMLTGKNPDSATVGMFMPAAATASGEQNNEVEMEDYEHHSEYEMLDESEVIVEDDDQHNHESSGTLHQEEELQDVEVVDLLHLSPETSLTMAAPPTLEPPTDEAVVQHHSHSPLPPAPRDLVPEVAHDTPAAVVEHAVVEQTIIEVVSPADEAAHETDGGPETAASDHLPRELHEARSPAVDRLEAHPYEPLPFAAGEDGASTPTIGVAPPDHAFDVAANELAAPADSATYEAEAAIDEVDAGSHVEPESNPHEIADGVFIDPVPAVVVHASFSEQPLVLFNRPPASRPHSPSPDDDVPSDTVVLLHDRPALYYGPLSDLFAALREEELILQQPDMHHAELGLSVETLELSITEDNVHAKDFSLFQLNALHDSFHTGSLRVTLIQQVPRFITRYNELQEHLHRLGVHTHDDALLTAVPSSASEGFAEHRELLEHEVHATDDVAHQDASRHEHHQESHHEEPNTILHDGGEDHKPEEEQFDQATVQHDQVDSQHPQEEHTDDSPHINVLSQIPGQEEAEGDQHDVTEEHVEEAEVSHLDHAEETHVPEQVDVQAPPVGQDHHAEQQETDQPTQATESLVEETEVYWEATGDGERDQLEGDVPQEASEIVEVEEAIVDVGDHIAEEGNSNEEHEESQEQEDEESDHLGTEYGTEYDPDQVDANELQGDLGGEDDSEHSGEGHQEDTQETEEGAVAEALEDGYADERSPSPGAEDELPPIDTTLLHAVDADDSELLGSALTQDEWLGGEFGATTEERHDTETLDSNSEEGNGDTENYIDNDGLAYPEGDEEDGEWEHEELDGEGELADASWEGASTEQEETVLNDSTISVRPKRSFHEVDGDDEEVSELRPTPSPDSKRSRLE